MSARATGLLVGLVALLTALQLLRQVAVSAWGTIWAEDGFQFLPDALEQPFVATLVDPHGGYIHLPPRVVAAVAAALPLEHAAVAFAVSSALVVSLFAAFVFVASASVLESLSLRLGLAALVALLPAAGSELLGNAANLHFYLVFACFWSFVWRSATAAAITSRAAVAGVTALSNPFAALFVPLALWNVLRRRSRLELLVPLTFALGLAVHVAATLLAGAAPQRLTRFDPADVPLLFALRVTGSLLVGDGLLDSLWFSLGRVFAYGALVAVALALTVGAARSSRATRAFVAVSVGYAIAIFGGFLAGRGSAGMRPGTDEATWHLAGARFTYAPILFLATALLVTLDEVTSRLPRAWRSRVRIGAVTAIAALIAANFSFESERSLGPGWQEELERARGRCAQGAPEARILVAPAPFDFYFETSCGRILGGEETEPATGADVRRLTPG